MAFNTVPNGSYLYAADWDSIHTHGHTDASRDGQALNFGTCFGTAGSNSIHDHSSVASGGTISLANNLRRNRFYSASEVVIAGSRVFLPIGSMVLTHPANALLNTFYIGTYLKGSLSQVGSGVGLQIQFSGATLGNIYLENAQGGQAVDSSSTTQQAMMISSSGAQLFANTIGPDSYKPFATNLCGGLNLPDTSTMIYINGIIAALTTNIYISGTEMVATYFTNYGDD